MVISGLSTAESEAGMASMDDAPNSGAGVIVVVVGGAPADTTAPTASTASAVSSLGGLQVLNGKDLDIIVI